MTQLAATDTDHRAHAPVLEAGASVREYLTFRLGDEEYGVDILKVQEIRGYDAVTKIPDAPAFVKGVINLRGTIMPVVDMRLRFKLGEAVYDAYTVMIILQLERRNVGMVVDSVSDVLRLTDDQTLPPPEFGGAMDTRYISGLGSIDERLLILVDIERLMASDDMALTASSDASQAAH
ncbi:chemotaxis protein CheW [Abyssibacter sp.]|jgi:purine-binding chemotaxis protein CheW|uniref:chemotaxis protein CheW n=1 Tax=Abyssibacter sp. TaxID=2320200 RepID=UPI000C4691B6|nr:chemotaxis protein CheW [Xanthomonadales bacterium]